MSSLDNRNDDWFEPLPEEYNPNRRPVQVPELEYHEWEPIDMDRFDIESFSIEADL